MAILGDNSDGADTFPGNPDRALVTRFTATASGTSGTGYAYFASDSTAGSSAKLVIYSNVAGAPSALIGSSAGAVVPAGGGLINLGAITATIDDTVEYFVGVVWSDSQGIVSADAVTTEDTEMANGTLSYTTPPATWPGTDGTYGIRINAWMDYVAGAASPFPPWPQRIYQLGR